MLGEQAHPELVGQLAARPGRLVGPGRIRHRPVRQHRTPAAPRLPAPRSAGADPPQGPGTSSPPARPAPARSAAGRPAAATPIRVTGRGPEQATQLGLRIGDRLGEDRRTLRCERPLRLPRLLQACDDLRQRRGEPTRQLERDPVQPAASKAAWSRTGAVSPRRTSMQASAVSASSASAPRAGSDRASASARRSRPECPRGAGFGTASATSRRTPRRCVRAASPASVRTVRSTLLPRSTSAGKPTIGQSRDAAIDLLRDRAERPRWWLPTAARRPLRGPASPRGRLRALRCSGGQVAGLAQHRPRLVEHPVARQQVQRHPREVPVRGGHAHAGEPRDRRGDPVQQRALRDLRCGQDLRGQVGGRAQLPADRLGRAAQQGGDQLLAVARGGARAPPPGRGRAGPRAGRRRSPRRRRTPARTRS